MASRHHTNANGTFGYGTAILWFLQYYVKPFFFLSVDFRRKFLSFYLNLDTDRIAGFPDMWRFCQNFMPVFVISALDQRKPVSRQQRHAHIPETALDSGQELELSAPFQRCLINHLIIGPLPVACIDLSVIGERRPPGHKHFPLIG